VQAAGDKKMSNILTENADNWIEQSPASAKRTLQRHKLIDMLATGIMTVAAGLLVVVLLSVITLLLYKGLEVVNWTFLTTSGTFTEAGGGIGPQVFVSVYVLLLSLLFTTPIGVGAAIYLAEYAKPNMLTTAIRFSTETLASVPSIVFGIFGSIVFLTMMHLGYSVLSGALTLTLLNLPLMVRIAEDAIRSVPSTYREASLALAGTQWETIRKVVLPSALPGILTAIVLTSGRIIGETAPLILTTGTTISPNAQYSFDPFQTGETLAVHIWVLKIIGVPGLKDAQKVADGTAAVLLLIVLLLNVGVAYLSYRLQKNQKGARR
jgi:phosphate transport system permease protein